MRALGSSSLTVNALTTAAGGAGSAAAARSPFFAVPRRRRRASVHRASSTAHPLRSTPSTAAPVSSAQAAPAAPVPQPRSTTVRRGRGLGSSARTMARTSRKCAGP